jgi:lantibiotic modifying enzyme
MQRGIRFLDENLPNVKLYGLYDGVAGIAFSLAQLSENPDASAVCSKAIRDLIAGAKKQANGGVRWNDDNDIISGSAGIVLTLLSLGQELRRSELINLAVQAGTDLLARSITTAHGRYWLHKTVAEKQYPNFSHGTAGIAYFLLKLHEQTGEKRFLDAAIDGANYLNSIASSNSPTRCLLPHELPEQNDLFYLGWCHGPAGTDRFFFMSSLLLPKTRSGRPLRMLRPNRCFNRGFRKRKPRAAGTISVAVVERSRSANFFWRAAG